MSINFIENTKSIEKIDKVLDKTKITDEIIDNINKILTIENIDSILLDIEKFIENGKNLYKRYGTDIEKKEKILDYILKNISRLLNDLNIERVYNNTSYLLRKNVSKDGDLNKMKDFLTINGLDLYKNSIDGASCNEWVIWFYNLVKKITLNDIDIKYNFQINSNDSHGVLYISIGEKKYSFDSIVSGFRIEEIAKGDIRAKRKNKPTFYNNEDSYLQSFQKSMDKKDSIVYDYLGKKLKIVKKGGLLGIIYKNKPIKYINIYGLKRFTKNLSKILNLKYLGIVPKVYNSDNIIDFILSKIDDNDVNDVKIILSKIHDEKLLQFFNLSKR